MQFDQLKRREFITLLSGAQRELGSVMGGRPTMVVLCQLRDKTPAGRLYSGEGLVAAAAAGGSPVVPPSSGQ